MNAPDKISSDRMLRESAISELGWRLRDGKEVAGVSLLAIVDSELDTRAAITAAHVTDVLTNFKDRHLLADRLVEGMIERFLSTPKGREALEDEMRRQRNYEASPEDA